MTETVATESTENSSKRVRSSFTMDKTVMDALKAKAVTEDVSVSSVIEKAVAQYLGV
jgi:hypothetical protein